MATPRRSTRIAARTPVGSDAGSDAGDRRIDRRSKSPTNAGQVGRLVTTRIATSKAYGAGGPDDRASAEPEAMEAPTLQQGFASSFSRQRERARVSAEDPRRHLPEIPERSESSTHSSQVSSINNRSNARGSNKQSSKHDSMNHQSSKRTSNSFSRHSSVSSSRSYTTSSTAAVDERPRTRNTHSSSAGASRTWGDLREAAFITWAQHSPAWYAIARRIIRNYFGPIFAVLTTIAKFGAMIVGLLSSVLFFYLLFDMSLRTLFFRDVNASGYIHERAAQVINILPGSGPDIQPYPTSGDRHGSFTSLYNNVVQVQNKVGLLEKDVDYLQRTIPDSVMLTHNPKTGRNEIPGAFWHALRDNLAQEGITAGGSGNSPSWTDFWKHNKAHMDAYLSDAVDAKIKDAIKDSAPVDKKTFIKMVQDQFQRILVDVESTWSQKLDSKLKDFVASLPKGQMSTIANAVLLENAWSSLHSVNFFSKSLGAVVDPHLTSPTMASKGLVRRVLEQWTWIPGDLPPAAALVGWEEPTDCWCAARSPGLGRAQIGIIMPHKIVPRTLVVEHIPRDGTLDIGSAPRGMEVWVEVGDEGVRAAFDEEEKEDNKPGDQFVRVGSFEYKVDALNHVQAFDLNSQLLARHAVNKVVVRVTGTWGRDWSCLYRLRMNGELVEQFNGYAE